MADTLSLQDARRVALSAQGLRGARVTKGGVAAMIGAAQSLAKSGGLKSGRLIIAAVADEEHASLGAEAVVKKWRADGAVIQRSMSEENKQWEILQTADSVTAPGGP